MEVKFIIPAYNAGPNLEKLFNSLREQTDSRWSAIIIDDISEDRTFDIATELACEKFEIIKNKEKKYALRNIVEQSRRFQEIEDVVIAVIDGDDMLCNPETVGLLISAYEDGNDVVWTGHQWDVNGLNISKPLPPGADPYSCIWSSSHLRTFKSTLLKNISNKNFKNTKGEWFQRGYDQALMLPLLHVGNDRHYIDEICYTYNINSVSIPFRDYNEMNQISTINLVRARGFLK